jgi:hypothetical protein
MAQPEDRSYATSSNLDRADLDPDGATEARYAADDNLDLDAGPEPHNDQLDRQHGRKTRQARKDEISNRSL